MKHVILLILCLLILGTISEGRCNIRNKSAKPIQVDQADVNFNEWFQDKTMRFDFYHTGNANQEIFSVDKAINDGSWAGSVTQLIDNLELGPYFFEVSDKETRQVIYSRGFANIFGEWQTTPEAATTWKTFHESLRFPWPLKAVNIVIQKRDAENRFQTIWQTEIDPGNRHISQAGPDERYQAFTIEEHGPAHEKLDLVILGDGYTADEMEKFRADAKRLSDALLETEPFKTQRKNINIRAVETPASQSGVSQPHQAIFKRSPLSVSYSIFDSERYALSYDNKTLRDVASIVPYDFMAILINERTYGGGGIYNLYTTVAAGNKFAEYVMVHEMGHHLAALADEYYTSSVAYEAPKITLEPWEPNVTALLDKENLKWKDLVEPGTPIPTPWRKEDFDKKAELTQEERQKIRAEHRPETEMEALFDRQLKEEKAFFRTETYAEKVGAFEGANYNAKGMYRSEINCIMHTRHNVFCKVCQRSIVNVIEQYTK